MDVRQKMTHISNRLYNQGLEKAKVRDLSGAAACLEMSLKYDKNNISARNLLGLVYFELGETVEAISAWVLAKHLRPEDPMAEEFLKKIQGNGNQLEALNLTIKKYNQALTYCRNGSTDLAIIQLKSLLRQNPKLVKGHQLLALLYYKEEKYDLAKEALRAAGRIDTNNTTTLRYLREVNSCLHEQAATKKTTMRELIAAEEHVKGRKKNTALLLLGKLLEPSRMNLILHFSLGLVIGILILSFAVVPSVRQSANSNSNETLRELSDSLTTKTQLLNSLEAQVEELLAQIEVLDLNSTTNQTVTGSYEKLIEAYEALGTEAYITAYEALDQVETALLSQEGVNLYESIYPEILEGYEQTLYEEGYAAYKSSDYATAISLLQKLADLTEGYNDYYTEYYLAQSYRKNGDSETAKIYYQLVVDHVPGTNRATTAAKYL